MSLYYTGISDLYKRIGRYWTTDFGKSKAPEMSTIVNEAEIPCQGKANSGRVLEMLGRNPNTYLVSREDALMRMCYLSPLLHKRPPREGLHMLIQPCCLPHRLYAISGYI